MRDDLAMIRRKFFNSPKLNERERMAFRSAEFWDLDGRFAALYHEAIKHVGQGRGFGMLWQHGVEIVHAKCCREGPPLFAPGLLEQSVLDLAGNF